MEADTNYSQCNSLKTQILLMQILNFSACHLAPNTRIIKNITWKSVCVNVCCINGTQLGCSIKKYKNADSWQWHKSKNLEMSWHGYSEIVGNPVS